MTPTPKKKERKEKHLGPRVDVLSIRWRELLPEQRQAVTMALAREFSRLRRLAEASAGKALLRSANAGACRIARDLLREIGGHP